MHLPDGILPVPICVAGFIVSGGASLLALRRLDDRDVPRLAVMTASFFALGALHVRIGPGSVHFLLAGLLAMAVGWRAILAVTLGVFMHAVLLQHGGLTTVGVNACVMGLPALAVGAALQRWGGAEAPSRVGLTAALATVVCYLLSIGVFLLMTQLADRQLSFSLGVWAASYAPVAVLEAVATGAAAAFLGRVDRGVLQACASRQSS